MTLLVLPDLVPLLSGPTLSAARGLLGAQLWVQKLPQTGLPAVFTIVETEAYTADDPACHAYRQWTQGKPLTGRSATMAQPPGTAYVYFTYGMHYCLNIVTEPLGTPAAVLIRALEPVTPLPEGMLPLSLNGPARLCKALGLSTATHNGLNLLSEKSPLQLRLGHWVPDEAVTQTTRIGIKQSAHYPWRFYITQSSSVSVKIKPEKPGIL